MSLVRSLATLQPSAANVSLLRHFTECMNSFPALAPSQRLGLCVSGGPDSMALLWLAREWAATSGAKLMVAHVNHGLRATAHDESVWLRDIVEREGIPFALRVLKWEPNEPASHESLRAKRYASVHEMALEWGCRFMATAHHRNDVVETFVQRIHMASGLPGLAHPIANQSFLWPGSSVSVIRPLLGLSKAALIASLPRPPQYIRDPLNQSPKYLRSRVRAVLDADPLLTDDIGTLCSFIGQEWATVEGTAASLDALYVDRKNSTSTVTIGLVQILRWHSPHEQQAARLVLRNCLARARDTTRWGEAALDHLLQWLRDPTTTEHAVRRWSEGGVAVSWHKRGAKFVIEPLAP